MSYPYDLPDELVVTEKGPVRILTLNRPDDLNACNEAMHDGLARIWRQFAADRDARAIVITGAGRAFSAGGDFNWLTQINREAPRQDAAATEALELMSAMIHCPLPIVAAVNGPAVGLGCSLTILSDLVLIARTAHLADPHVSVGMVAGDGGAFWPAMTSMHRAKEFLFLGGRVSSEQAVELGLANRVVEPDQLQPEALKLAERLAAQPARALQDTKRALNSSLMAGGWAGAVLSSVGERISMDSAEHAEKLASLLGPAKN